MRTSDNGGVDGMSAAECAAIFDFPGKEAACTGLDLPPPFSGTAKAPPWYL